MDHKRILNNVNTTLLSKMSRGKCFRQRLHNFVQLIIYDALCLIYIGNICCALAHCLYECSGSHKSQALVDPYSNNVADGGNEFQPFVKASYVHIQPCLLRYNKHDERTSGITNYYNIPVGICTAATQTALLVSSIYS